MRIVAFIFLSFSLFLLSCDKEEIKPIYIVDVDSAIEYSWSEEVNDTGDRIGGGIRGHEYNRAVSRGNIVVNDRNGFINALTKASAGDVIFIGGRDSIDLTGINEINIKSGVTLASDRGYEKSFGALIYTTDKEGAYPFFLLKNPNVRITGLRIQGPDPRIGDEAWAEPNSIAIRCSNTYNIEIDNCEIYAFSHAGINATNGSRNINVHHNFIHHCRRTGLGYGININGSQVLVEANIFQSNRRSIAGTGVPGTSYHARLNIGMSNDGYSHSFDMHACGEGSNCQGKYLQVAGDSIKISQNTFYNTQQHAVKVRGIPQYTLIINDNWFLHSSLEFALIVPKENSRVRNNLLGNYRKLVK